MFPNFNMGDEVKFLQRWDFRRRDSDFDSDNSQSSSSDESVLKKHKLVSSFISLDNDASTSRLEEKHDKNADHGDQTKLEKAKELKIRKSKKGSLANNEPIREFEEPKVNKSRTSACEHTALDDVKSFMESLVEDLKVAREDLFKWMREEMHQLGSVDADAQPLRTKKRNHTRKKVQPQHPKKSKKNVGTQQRGKKKNVKVDNQNIQVEDQNKIQETFQQRGKKKNVKVNNQNIQVEDQNKIQETFQQRGKKKNVKVNNQNIQVEDQNKIQETFHVQQQNMEKNVGKQDESKPEYEMRSQNCDAGSTIFKSNKATHPGNNCQALGDVATYGQLMSESVVAVEKKKGKRPASSINSTFHHKNVQAQQQKSIVLGIRAPSYKNEGLGRCVEGKVFADDVDRDQVTGKSKEDHLGLPIEPKFSFNPSGQVASSMYLNLPTILSESSVTSNRLDAFSCDYIQSLVAGHRACVNSERSNHSNAHPRYLPPTQQEETIGSFPEMNSRNTQGLYDQTSFLTGGYPVPLHGINGGFRTPSQVYSEDLQLENRNKMGLRINGGALVPSGGSYALADQYVASNLHSYSNLKPPTSNVNDGHLFLD